MHQVKDAGATACPTTAHAAWAELAKLGLNAEEIAGLKNQGYVESRRRNGGGVFWLLRYRRERKLHSIYLGSDAQRVADIKAELEKLQSSRRRQQELKRAVRHGTTTLLEVKRQLRPTMCLLRLHFHGDQLRRSRARKRETQTANGGTQ